jgi:murein DD-endopeptidase MepM/ murein hydrolase activator NlpD
MGRVVLRFRSDFARGYQFLMVAFLLGMSVITAALIFEYRFFKNQIQELTELKHNYNICIQALRRHVLEAEQKVSTSPVAKQAPLKTAKKKNDRRFLLVNREHKYLKREALKFARSHNLERPIGKLYEKREANTRVPKCSVRTPSRPQKRRTVRIRRRRVRRVSRKYRVRVLDEKLRELKAKVGLKCPLTKSQYWISSPFGSRKKSDGSDGFHAGVDLAAVRGTPIHAAAEGTVLQAGYYKGYGNMVLLAHKHKVKTRYAHLSKITVKVGDRVAQNKVIGHVGNTGHVRRRKGHDGSHLHFEVYIGAKRIDPLSFIDS